MTADGSPSRLVPSNVVGILRAQVRQRDATIAALQAENQGQAVEIERLRAALGRHGNERYRAVESPPER